jgi:KDO2-lipid IV(A) lauroyltransferase
MLNRLGVALMQGLARLPLAWLRGLGWLLGLLLYAVAAPRRRVARVNLGLCFPDLSPQTLQALTRRSFVCFAQAWLDRAWLWHGAPAVVRRRLHLTGELGQLDGVAPLVIFAPHFVGLDAGWTALTQQLPRRFTTIYTRAAQPGLDAWIQAGRQRFGDARLFARIDAAKPVLTALRAGEPLYLLPDMNFDVIDSVFVPFFGVPAATLPSLSRFARLGRARVVPVLSRLTRTGYEVQVLPAWTDVPSDDLQADTALMNQRLAAYISTMPEQYYWVHKRFKDRPPGMPSVY